MTKSTTKCCPLCKQRLKLTKFYFLGKHLSAYCKACQKVYMRLRYLGYRKVS